jgi:hypothetical protein
VTHTFIGRRFRILDQSLLKGDDLGECDWEKRTMNVPIEGDTIGELDVLIHEALHAAYPSLDEYYVNRGATDIARLLWRLGWRKD